MTTVFRYFIYVAAACPTVLQAQSFENHATIDAQVAVSLTGSGLAALPIDRRLKLIQCPQPLQVDPPLQGLVAVRCPARGWRVHARLAGPSAVPASAATMLVVRRGDPVQIELVARGFSIMSAGVADSDARVGDSLRVRVDQKNASQKNASIVGDVVGPGMVRVVALN